MQRNHPWSRGRRDGNASEPARLGGSGSTPGNLRPCRGEGGQVGMGDGRRIPAATTPGRFVSSQSSRWQGPLETTLPPLACPGPAVRTRVGIEAPVPCSLAAISTRGADRSLCDWHACRTLGARQPRKHHPWQRRVGRRGHASPHTCVSRLIGNSARCGPGRSPLFLRTVVYVCTPQCERWGKAVDHPEHASSPFTHGCWEGPNSPEGPRRRTAPEPI